MTKIAAFGIINGGYYEISQETWDKFRKQAIPEEMKMMRVMAKHIKKLHWESYQNHGNGD